MADTKNTQKVNILIVDDHAVIRAGLRLLIETNKLFEVCGEAGNCRTAVEVAESSQPDLILLDIDLDGENSLQCMPDLLRAALASRVLVLTGLNDARLHAQALKAGAMGLVLKEKAADVLLKAIEKVHYGEVWFDRTTMGSVLAQMSRSGGRAAEDPEGAKISSLTDREREVVTLIGEGLKNRQIAERLFISETTVRHHLTSVFDKLGVSDRLELVIYAYRHNLAKPPK
jgi:two-component system, NarL family, nitrate/nitrite response regulator NarL